MDAGSLAVVLQAALSPSLDERKAAEESLNQLQYASEYLVRLLQIVVHGSFDMAVRQAASIHLKNVIAKTWLPNESGETQKIPTNDKSMVRENILVYISQVPPLLRAQLGECLKTIIHADYPEQWPTLLRYIQCNLQLQDLQVHGVLYVLRILSRKYEFKSDEERRPLYQIVDGTFPALLDIFNQLVQVVNPSLDVADLIKLICKIFWSSIYLEIPKHFSDPNMFNAWMVLFLNVLERPVPSEGQPIDLEFRKSWGWWKVKKWTIHILNRLYTRFGDVKLQNPESRVFAQMFHKSYAGKILECHLRLLNAVRVGQYLPDRVINLILQYLNNSISKNSMYNLLLPQIDILLFEIVFPLICFNDNDQRLWNEDPHEYVRKGYDIIEDLYSPRTAAMDFVSELIRKRGKGNLEKFVHFIVVIFQRYNESPEEVKPYRQKDGALLAIGTLCDKLRQSEPYKSDIENMLVQHVFPEFRSHVGHLRAKAAWVAGQYAHINFSEQSNFNRALHFVVSGLRDPELPVRVDSVFALRSFIEACRDLNEIRPFLPQLLDEFFKLLNEVENEDLVLTLETIVDKFGEEMEPYAIELCQNLANTFWKCIRTSEADGEADDSGALAAVGCLRAISTILVSVSRHPQLFVEIEPILLPIMQRMLTNDGQEVFEEVLEIVSYMTFYSPTISLEMWELWPLIMEALRDWAIDFFGNIFVPLGNYISRCTLHFLNCRSPNYQQDLWNALSTIMSDKNLDDGDIESAPKLIGVVFQNCRGQVDQWVEPYLRITIDRLHKTRKSNLKSLLMKVVADALYYNAALTLGILQKLGVATNVFSLWFHMLQEVTKNGDQIYFKREHDKKVCCLGLTSMLGLTADQLPGEAFARVFQAALELLASYKDQTAEARREDEGDDDDDDDDDDMDGSLTDEDQDDDFSGETGDDTVDGNETDITKLQRLTAQARSFQPNNEDYESDEDYSDDELQSPLDEIDPLIFFVDYVKVVQESDPARILNMMQTLEVRYQVLVSDIAQHANMRINGANKEKLKKQFSSRPNFEIV